MAQLTFEISNYLTPAKETGYTVSIGGLSEKQLDVATHVYVEVMRAQGKYQGHHRKVYANGRDPLNCNLETGDEATALVKALQKEGIYFGDPQNQKYEGGIPATIKLAIQTTMANLAERQQLGR